MFRDDLKVTKGHDVQGVQGCSVHFAAERGLGECNTEPRGSRAFLSRLAVALCSLYNASYMIPKLSAPHVVTSIFALHRPKAYAPEDAIPCARLAEIA
jgi:hypothetical protein